MKKFFLFSSLLFSLTGYSHSVYAVNACEKSFIGKITDEIYFLRKSSFYGLSTVETPLRDSLYSVVIAGDLRFLHLMIRKNIIDDIDARNNYGQTVLHHANDVEIAKALIGAGADVNATDNMGKTPLYWAVNANSDIKLIEFLINAGAIVNAKDIYDSTALHRAAFRGYSKIADLLLREGADPNAKNNDGDTPLHATVSKDHLPEKGHLEIMTLLLAKGVDVDARNSIWGFTALHMAIDSTDRLRMIEMLLENGADPNVKDHLGRTPLKFAMEHKFLKRETKNEIKKLLEAKKPSN